jgi:hypothetical protein
MSKPIGRDQMRASLNLALETVCVEHRCPVSILTRVMLRQAFSISNQLFEDNRRAVPILREFHGIKALPLRNMLPR